MGVKLHPLYPVTRKDKSILSGMLTSRLVNEDAAYGALVDLAKNSSRCTILVQMSAFDYRKGEARTKTNLVIEKEDLLSEEGSHKDKILRSRKVTVIAYFRDDGVAIINPGRRSWSSINDSNELRHAMLEYGRRLNSESRIPFLAGGWALVYAFYPFSLGIPVALLDSILAFLLNEEVRRNYREEDVTPTFHYISEELFTVALVYPWPFFLLLTAIIWLLQFLGGGLLVWPKSLGAASVHSFLYFLVKKSIPEDAKLIKNTVITIITTAIVTFLITR